MSGHDPSFLDHLEALRGVLIKSAAAWIAGMVLAGFRAKEIIDLLRAPLAGVLAGRQIHPDQFLITLGVTDPLILTIQVAAFAGLILACPFIFYFFGKFFIPAIPNASRGKLVLVFLFGGGLFLSGVAFCYALVLPQALAFFLEFNRWLGWEPFWTIRNYLQFTLQMLLAFGISFELPLVLTILGRMGLMTRAFLAKYRRHAIVVLVIFSASVTPTSDPFNLALLFVPMYVLYEVSIWLVGWVQKKRS